MLSLLIKNGRIVDPASGLDEKADLWVRDGKIAALSPSLSAGDPDNVIDASGLLVTPGFIDIHVHLREPGFEHKETIATGCAAAVAGGFTSLACMANTKPVNDSPEITRFILKKAREATGTRVYPIAALTQGLKGKTLSPMAALKEAGAAAFSDDGMAVTDEELMRRALEEAKRLGVPVISHCEMKGLHPGGVMHEGEISRRLGLKGIPRESEDRMVERDIRLARETGAHLHIAHISTAGAVDLVRKAKEEGLRVTGEVAPHHFTLTEEAMEGGKADAKMSPPLRSRSDVEAVREGLADGTIDVVATDHAPHAAEEKAAGVEQAPFGIVGLETALPLVMNLVRDKVIDLPRAVALLTAGPAGVLGLPAGRICLGAEADITIFDPEEEWTVDPAAFKSKGRNTPFSGWKMKGRVRFVLVGGNILYDLLWT